MIFYVDGYNLLFKLAPKKTSLEDKRSQVIASLNDLALKLKLNMILVFDATKQRERLGIARGHYDALEIIYTEYKNADDFILEEVERAPSPSQITVVTSDRELSGRIKQLGAKSLTIREFIHWLHHKKAKRKATFTASPVFKDSEKNINRLLKIFEEKLEKHQDED